MAAAMDVRDAALNLSGTGGIAEIESLFNQRGTGVRLDPAAIMAERQAQTQEKMSLLESSAIRGWKQLTANSAAIMALYNEGDAEEAGEIIAEMNRTMPEQDPRVAAVTGSTSAMGFLANWALHPITSSTGIAAESLVSSSPSLLLGTAGGLAAGPGGAMVGAGLGSFVVEQGSWVLGKLAESGVDMTDADSVASALRDPAIMGPIKAEATRKAAGTAAFDAASTFLAFMPTKAYRTAAKAARDAAKATKGMPKELATRLARQAGAEADAKIKQTVRGFVRSTLAQTGVQMGMGGLGEAAGLAAATLEQPFTDANMPSIFAEIIGEGPGGAVEVVAGATKRMLVNRAALKQKAAAAGMVATAGKVDQKAQEDLDKKLAEPPAPAPDLETSLKNLESPEPEGQQPPATTQPTEQVVTPVTTAPQVATTTPVATSTPAPSLTDADRQLLRDRGIDDATIESMPQDQLVAALEEAKKPSLPMPQSKTVVPENDFVKGETVTISPDATFASFRGKTGEVVGVGTDQVRVKIGDKTAGFDRKFLSRPAAGVAQAPVGQTAKEVVTSGQEVQGQAGQVTPTAATGVQPAVTAPAPAAQKQRGETPIEQPPDGDVVPDPDRVTYLMGRDQELATKVDAALTSNNKKKDKSAISALKRAGMPYEVAVESLRAMRAQYNEMAEETPATSPESPLGPEDRAEMAAAKRAFDEEQQRAQAEAKKIADKVETAKSEEERQAIVEEHRAFVEANPILNQEFRFGPGAASASQASAEEQSLAAQMFVGGPEDADNKFARFRQRLNNIVNNFIERYGRGPVTTPEGEVVYPIAAGATAKDLYMYVYEQALNDPSMLDAKGEESAHGPGGKLVGYPGNNTFQSLAHRILADHYLANPIPDALSTDAPVSATGPKENGAPMQVEEGVAKELHDAAQVKGDEPSEEGFLETVPASDVAPDDSEAARAGISAEIDEKLKELGDRLGVTPEAPESLESALAAPEPAPAPARPGEVVETVEQEDTELDEDEMATDGYDPIHTYRILAAQNRNLKWHNYFYDKKNPGRFNKLNALLNQAVWAHKRDSFLNSVRELEAQIGLTSEPRAFVTPRGISHRDAKFLAARVRRRKERETYDTAQLATQLKKLRFRLHELTKRADMDVRADINTIRAERRKLFNLRALGRRDPENKRVLVLNRGADPANHMEFRANETERLTRAIRIRDAYLAVREGSGEISELAERIDNLSTEIAALEAQIPRNAFAAAGREIDVPQVDAGGNVATPRDAAGNELKEELRIIDETTGKSRVRRTRRPIRKIWVRAPRRGAGGLAGEPFGTLGEGAIREQAIQAALTGFANRWVQAAWIDTAAAQRAAIWGELRKKYGDRIDRAILTDEEIKSKYGDNPPPELTDQDVADIERALGTRTVFTVFRDFMSGKIKPNGEALRPLFEEALDRLQLHPGGRSGARLTGKGRRVIQARLDHLFGYGPRQMEADPDMRLRDYPDRAFAAIRALMRFERGDASYFETRRELAAARKLDRPDSDDIGWKALGEKVRKDPAAVRAKVMGHLSYARDKGKLSKEDYSTASSMVADIPNNWLGLAYEVTRMLTKQIRGGVELTSADYVLARLGLLRFAGATTGSLVVNRTPSRRAEPESGRPVPEEPPLVSPPPDDTPEQRAERDRLVQLVDTPEEFNQVEKREGVWMDLLAKGPTLDDVVADHNSAARAPEEDTRFGKDDGFVAGMEKDIDAFATRLRSREFQPLVGEDPAAANRNLIERTNKREEWVRSMEARLDSREAEIRKSGGEDAARAWVLGVRNPLRAQISTPEKAMMMRQTGAIGAGMGTAPAREPVSLTSVQKKDIESATDAYLLNATNEFEYRQAVVRAVETPLAPTVSGEGMAQAGTAVPTTGPVQPATEAGRVALRFAENIISRNKLASWIDETPDRSLDAAGSIVRETASEIVPPIQVDPWFNDQAKAGRLQTELSRLRSLTDSWAKKIAEAVVRVRGDRLGEAASIVADLTGGKINPVGALAALGKLATSATIVEGEVTEARKARAAEEAVSEPAEVAAEYASRREAEKLDERRRGLLKLYDEAARPKATKAAKERWAEEQKNLTDEDRRILAGHISSKNAKKLAARMKKSAMERIVDALLAIDINDVPEGRPDERTEQDRALGARAPQTYTGFDRIKRELARASVAIRDSATPEEVASHVDDLINKLRELGGNRAVLAGALRSLGNKKAAIESVKATISALRGIRSLPSAIQEILAKHPDTLTDKEARSLAKSLHAAGQSNGLLSARGAGRETVTVGKWMREEPKTRSTIIPVTSSGRQTVQIVGTERPQASVVTELQRLEEAFGGAAGSMSPGESVISAALAKDAQSGKSTTSEALAAMMAGELSPVLVLRALRNYAEGGPVLRTMGVSPKDSAALANYVVRHIAASRGITFEQALDENEGVVAGILMDGKPSADPVILGMLGLTPAQVASGIGLSDLRGRLNPEREEFRAAMAGLLSRFKGGIRKNGSALKIRFGHISKGSLAYYIPFTHEVVVDLSNSLAYAEHTGTSMDDVIWDALTHEATHAAVSSVIAAYESGNLAALTQRQLSAVQELESAWRDALAASGHTPESAFKLVTGPENELFRDTVYGLTSLQEFAAEAMSNRAFANVLASIGGSPRAMSLLERVRRALSDILGFLKKTTGFRRAPSDNLYDRTLYAVITLGEDARLNEAQTGSVTGGRANFFSGEVPLAKRVGPDPSSHGRVEPSIALNGWRATIPDEVKAVLTNGTKVVSGTAEGNAEAREYVDRTVGANGDLDASRVAADGDLESGNLTRTQHQAVIMEIARRSGEAYMKLSAGPDTVATRAQKSALASMYSAAFDSLVRLASQAGQTLANLRWFQFLFPEAYFSDRYTGPYARGVQSTPAGKAVEGAVNGGHRKAGDAVGSGKKTGDPSSDSAVDRLRDGIRKREKGAAKGRAKARVQKASVSLVDAIVRSVMSALAANAATQSSDPAAIEAKVRATLSSAILTRMGKSKKPADLTPAALLAIAREYELGQATLKPALEALAKELEATRPDDGKALAAALRGMDSYAFSRNLQLIVRETLNERGMPISKIIREHVSVQNAVVDDLVRRMVEEGGLSGKDARAIADATKAVYDHVAARATMAQIEAIKRNDPSLRKDLDNFTEPHVKRLIGYANMGAVVDRDFYRAVADRLRLPTWDPKFAADIQRRARDISAMANGSVQRGQASVQLASEIAHRHAKDAGGARYYGPLGMAIWKASLLSGPPTWGVNALFTHANVWLEAMSLALGQAASSKRMPTGAVANAYAGLVRSWWKGGKESEGAVEARSAWTTGQTRGSSEKLEPTSLLESFNAKSLKDSKGIWDFVSSNWMALYKFVMRGMGAADGFNYAGAYGAMRRAMMYDMMLEQGMSREEATAKIDQMLDDPDARARAEKKAAAEWEAGQFSGLKNPTLARRKRVLQLIEEEQDAALGMGAEEKEAMDEFALRSTLNNEPVGIIGLVLGGGLQALNTTTQVSGVLFPFTRTLANLVNVSLDWSPYGLARAWTDKSVGNALIKMRGGDKRSAHWRKPFSERIAEGDRTAAGERAQLYIKGAVGSAVMVVAILMAKKGFDDEEEGREASFMVTGSGPRDPARAAQLREAGIPQNSIGIRMPIGGMLWLKFADWPALGPFLAALGNISDGIRYDKMGEKELGAFASIVALSMPSVMLDKGILQGASAFFDIVQNPNERGARKAQRFAGNVVSGFTKPAAIRWVESAYMSLAGKPPGETRTLPGYIASLFPVAGFAANPRINVLGEPIRYSLSAFWTSRFGIAAGVWPKEFPEHPVLSPLVAAGLTVPPPYRQTKIVRPGGKESSMSEREFYEFAKAYGAAAKSALTPATVASLERLAARDRALAQDRLNSIVRARAREAGRRAVYRFIGEGD